LTGESKPEAGSENLADDPWFPYWRLKQFVWALSVDDPAERTRRIRRVNAVVELIKTDKGEIEAMESSP